MSCVFSSAPIFLWFAFATLNDCGQKYWTKYSSSSSNNKGNKTQLIYLLSSHPSSPALFALMGMNFSSCQTQDWVIAFYFCRSGGNVCFKGCKYGLCSQPWPSHCSAHCFAPQRLIKLPISSLHRFITFLSLLKWQRFSLLHWCIKFSLLSMIGLLP